jgi:gas vesicle protein
MFKRILRLVVVGWIVSMVAGAVAALQARRRIGPDSPESADDIVASAIFGPLDYHSTATSLRGGTLELWYGGGVLDLRDATLAPEGATLNVKVVFGGGQVLVPAEWRVVTAVSGLGGVQDVRGSKGEVAGAPTLTIAGTLIGGGFAVQSEPDEAMNAVRDGIQTARDKVDEATETARQKVDETTETARQKIDETTGQVQDAIAKATDGAGSAADDGPTESLEIESDSEMTPAS